MAYQYSRYFGLVFLWFHRVEGNENLNWSKLKCNLITSLEELKIGHLAEPGQCWKELKHVPRVLVHPVLGHPDLWHKPANFYVISLINGISVRPRSPFCGVYRGYWSTREYWYAALNNREKRGTAEKFNPCYGVFKTSMSAWSLHM